MTRFANVTAVRPFLLATILAVAAAPSMLSAQDGSNIPSTITPIPVTQRPRLAIRDFQFQAQLSREEQSELNGWAGAVYLMRGGNPQQTAETNASNLAKSTTQFLTERLQTSGQFRVFEREQVDAVTSEQDLVASDRAAKNQSVAATGALQGAKYVVTGAITKFGKSQKKSDFKIGGILPKAIGGMVAGRGKTDYEVGITVKVIDASTGEVMASATTEGEVSGDTERRLAGLAGTWGGIAAGAMSKSATGEREKRITEALQRAVDLVLVKLIEARERGDLTT